MGRWVLRLVRGIAVLLLGYAAAGVVGSIVADGGVPRPADGRLIWVADNGVHTDLVLPASALAGLVAPEALGDRRAALRSHVAVGWGDRDFYLNTPSWRDVNPLRVARALVGGGETVLHVAHVDPPRGGAEVRPVLLRPDEYRRLVAYVRASFVAGPAVPGYGPADAFYPARGGYSAIDTCNEWTAEALRRADVRMGAWTPFAFGVMHWL